LQKTSPPGNGGTSTSPRAYAFEIIKARTREERNRLLSLVPAHLQGLVKRHVTNHWERNRDIEVSKKR
jgi:hypothetical protein